MLRGNTGAETNPIQRNGRIINRSHPQSAAHRRPGLCVALSPDGFNLGMNLGQVAGAGVADHLHQHLVPRWSGDTNFMPVLGDVKVMSEHIRVTYDKLRAAFDALS